MSISSQTSMSNAEDVWFVDSGTPNHITSYQESFRDLRESNRPGYVEIGDDTTHPVRHVGNVSRTHQPCTRGTYDGPTCVELTKLVTTQEHEARDEEGDKME